MRPTYARQKALHQARIDVKSCERMLSNLISDGTSCSRFESDVIVEKAKEVFGLGEYAEGTTLQPGQMVWLALSAQDGAGKPLVCCQFRRVVLTHTNLREDNQVRQSHGLSARRQQQVLRMATEARDQGALLTQEDLAELLDSDVRTIRRDIQNLGRRGLLVPTRGRQKDIGPTISHRVKTIELFLDGKEPLEIARQIQHSISAVERYIDAFCRVVFCQRRFRSSLKTALVVGVSVSTVSHYMDLHAQACQKAEYRSRIREIEQKGRMYWEYQDMKKKRGPTERRSS